MDESILISQFGKEFAVTVHVSGHSRTYPADSLEAANIRAERLAYILDLKPDIIKYFKLKVNKGVVNERNRI